ncbi:MAG TPA: hypothetical protein VIM69_13270 [Opitutaceae bacterium]
MIAPAHDSSRPNARALAPVMVRYSLPELLEEVELERAAGSIGLQKVDQSEITKLFQAKPKRRRGSSRS